MVEGVDVNIVLTGSSGFLGWHIRCALHSEGLDTVSLDREAFWNPGSELLLKNADFVIHAAGVNRGSDDEVYSGNIEIAQHLAKMYTQSESQACVVYLNSTHIERSTQYGASKAQAARILSEATKGRLVDLILPNVFGEMGRPFYNSVVSTFCHQIATGVPLSINDDAPLELIHAQNVADEIISLIRNVKFGQIRITGHVTSVREVANELLKISQNYSENILPSTLNNYERALFNTLRSYEIPTQVIHQLDPKIDQRGHLVEIVKTESGGQLFVSWTKPGITRGNHYHRFKVERFVVLDGNARIRIRRMFSKNMIEVVVDGEKPMSLDIPTLHTHEITNIGTSILLTAFWTDEIFDPRAPETYPEVV
jgi:UDP-2-acetamido-2,6-beta-L-arabino-hexul-4-ose reductase